MYGKKEYYVHICNNATDSIATVVPFSVMMFIMAAGPLPTTVEALK